MSYLKGGTVVDGNLYVEGTLIAKKESAEEGVVYTYAKNLDVDPKIKHLAKFDDSDGQLTQSAISESYDTDNDRLVLNSNAIPVFIAVPANSLSIEYFDEGGLASKNSLSAFTDDGIKIQETAFLPKSTPKWWCYDDAIDVAMVSLGKVYTIPGENVTGSTVGSSLLVSGKPEGK